MTITEDLEKRIKNLEKEVQHLKVQYNIKKKIKREDLIRWSKLTEGCII